MVLSYRDFTASENFGNIGPGGKTPYPPSGYKPSRLGPGGLAPLPPPGFDPRYGGCSGTMYGCCLDGTPRSCPPGSCLDCQPWKPPPPGFNTNGYCPDGTPAQTPPGTPGRCGGGTYNPPLGPDGKQWLDLDIPADVREKLYCTEQFKSCMQSIN
jgi:hypothetical protein